MTTVFFFVPPPSRTHQSSLLGLFSAGPSSTTVGCPAAAIRLPSRERRFLLGGVGGFPGGPKRLQAEAPWENRWGVNQLSSAKPDSEKLPPYAPRLRPPVVWKAPRRCLGGHQSVRPSQLSLALLSPKREGEDPPEKARHLSSCKSRRALHLHKPHPPTTTTSS
ncbi:hypothetical protein NFI96_030903 [Prochilodus magdalenae]|nr:hypothetical protein NFI96_030903 [Prochilodus magdalenae]